MADGHKVEHDYHLVNPSPWPLTASAFALILAIGAIVWMRSMDGGEGLFGLQGPTMFFIGLAGVVGVAFMWWRDCIREAHAGDYTPVVQIHLRYGMLLFIASEVMFFVAWFWAYFDVALFPSNVHNMPIYAPDGTVTPSDKSVIGMVDRNALTGGVWPPKPTEDLFKATFDPWGLPLVNTLVLLLSGTTITWAHHALLENNRSGLIWGLFLTVALGVLFTALQVYEYGHAAFSFSGHIYGATFYMATGFHGFHVVVGTIFLAVCLFRALAGHFTTASITSASRPPPGTGTSSTWCGCSCSSASMSWVQEPTPGTEPVEAIELAEGRRRLPLLLCEGGAPHAAEISRGWPCLAYVFCDSGVGDPDRPWHVAMAAHAVERGAAAGTRRRSKSTTGRPQGITRESHSRWRAGPGPVALSPGDNTHAGRDHW